MEQNSMKFDQISCCISQTMQYSFLTKKSSVFSYFPESKRKKEEKGGFHLKINLQPPPFFKRIFLSGSAYFTSSSRFSTLTVWLLAQSFLLAVTILKIQIASEMF